MINQEILNKPLIIAGPCSIESEEQINEIAKELSELGIKFLRGGAFKPRTNPNSFQGLGNEGIKILKKIASKYNMYTVTEVMTGNELIENYDLIDVVQIGSRNMSSFGLLKEIGKLTAKDKKPILMKRGMNSTLNEMILASKYISNQGNDNIIFCLRGIRTFEQIDSEFRFTPDLAGILELKEKIKYPVIFDPSHSTGNSKYVGDISLGALALGADGLIIEVHNNPKEAMSDGKQSLTIDEFKKLFIQIKK